MDALLASDEAAIRNLVAHDAGVHMVLTGEGEWYRGHDEVVGMVLLRRSESEIIRFEYERVYGFERGDVAWVMARVINHRATTDPMALRHSVTLVLEAGTWRVTLWHVSRATPNLEVFGHEMPKSLGDLVSSFEASPSDLGFGPAAGTVTIMFTDIENSTAVSEGVGDARWTQMISDHFAVARQVIEGSGGTVVKTLGDGTMSTFGSAGAALEAAVGLQRMMVGGPFKVRIGLHSGDSLRSERDYYGTSVNKAARIGAVAGGGEIVVSSVTAELASGQDVAYGAPRTVTLKGLEGTHVILPVLWDSHEGGSVG